ncbi:MAG: hypothetical protein QG635_817, partial [Bacteroidota bacterium]|nr:hypothetical protein [Bacteroidota bacterium]
PLCKRGIKGDCEFPPLQKGDFKNVWNMSYLFLKVINLYNT